MRITVPVAECKDGVGTGGGHDRFDEVLKDFPSVNRVIEEYHTSTFSVARHKRYSLARAARKANLILVSKGLGPKDFAGLPMAHERSLQSALDLALSKVGKNADLLVAPSSATLLLELGS